MIKKSNILLIGLMFLYGCDSPEEHKENPNSITNNKTNKEHITKHIKKTSRLKDGDGYITRGDARIIKEGPIRYPRYDDGLMAVTPKEVFYGTIGEAYSFGDDDE